MSTLHIQVHGFPPPLLHVDTAYKFEFLIEEIDKASFNHKTVVAKPFLFQVEILIELPLPTGYF